MENWPRKGGDADRLHIQGATVPLGEQLQLFDNERDRYQQRNIVAEEKPLVAELRKELDGWLEHTGDPWARA